MDVHAICDNSRGREPARLLALMLMMLMMMMMMMMMSEASGPWVPWHIGLSRSSLWVTNGCEGPGKVKRVCRSRWRRRWERHAGTREEKDVGRCVIQSEDPAPQDGSTAGRAPLGRGKQHTSAQVFVFRCCCFAIFPWIVHVKILQERWIWVWVR